jgi:hypothetical protein
MASENVAGQPHLALRTPPKAGNCSVVGVIPQRGEWLAVYSVLRIGKGDSPTVVDVCRITDLPTLQKKKAESWQAAFGRFSELSSPTMPA